jgi:hypothetical protein
MFTRPIGTNPAASIRCTTGAFAPAGGALAKARDPAGVGSPAMSNRSFSATGIPAQRLGARPARRSASIASAIVRA